MTYGKTRAALAVLLVGLLVAACDDPASKERKYLTRGNDYFRKGEYDKARLEYRNAIKVRPTDAEVRYRIGLLEEAQGNLSAAYGSFVGAEQQDPRYVPALLKLAEIHIAADDLDQAGRRLATVFEVERDNAEAHALKAALLLKRDDPAGAGAEAEQAARLDPRNRTAAAVRATLLSRRGQTAQAIAVLDETLTRLPGDFRLLAFKIDLFQQAGDADGVERAYRDLLAAHPEARPVWASLVQHLVERRRIDAAEQVLRQALAAHPGDLDLERLLIMLLGDQRGIEAAETQARAFLAAAPEVIEPYFWLAELLLRHDRFDRAVAVLEEIVAKRRTETPGLNARTLLARVSLARGDRALAESLIATVLKKDPGNRNALLLRASLAFDDGQLQQAVADLRAILRERSNDPQVLPLLAETLMRQGYLNLAVDTATRLVEAFPQDPGARVRLAQLTDANGDVAHARALLTEAAALDPKFPVVWETQARLALAHQDLAGARQAVETLARLPDQGGLVTFLEGEILLTAGKPQEAIAKYIAAVEAGPDQPLAEHALTALLAACDQSKRIDTARAFLESMPRPSAFALTLLGEIHLAQGDAEQAAEMFDRAISRGEKRAEPFLDRARIELEARNLPQAADVLRRGMTEVPSDVRLPMQLAAVSRDMGRPGEAIALYDGLLSNNPGLDIAANNMAALIADLHYSDQKALDRAAAVAERFLGSNDPAALDTLAWVYCRQGRIANAQVLADRIATATNIPAEVHYHLGEIYAQAGRRDDAVHHLQLAINSPEPYPGLDEARRTLRDLGPGAGR